MATDNSYETIYEGQGGAPASSATAPQVASASSLQVSESRQLTTLELVAPQTIPGFRPSLASAQRAAPSQAHSHLSGQAAVQIQSQALVQELPEQYSIMKEGRRGDSKAKSKERTELEQRANKLNRKSELMSKAKVITQRKLAPSQCVESGRGSGALREDAAFKQQDLGDNLPQLSTHRLDQPDQPDYEVVGGKMRIEGKTRSSALSRRPSGHAEGENQRSRRLSHRGVAMSTRAEMEKGNRDSHRGSIAALPVHVPQVTPVMPTTESTAPEKSGQTDSQIDSS